MILPWGWERSCPHAQGMELHPYPYPYPWLHLYPQRLYPCLCPLTHLVPSWVDLGGVWGLDPYLLLGVPQKLTPMDLAHCRRMQTHVAPIHNRTMVIDCTTSVSPVDLGIIESTPAMSAQRQHSIGFGWYNSSQSFLGEAVIPFCLNHFCQCVPASVVQA